MFKIKSADLQMVCGVESKLPQHTLPEFAFAGRSNVGKSTLINGLMNRKSLARTSSQPGKTQTINFYNINDDFFLVDLPGYGYTKANVEVKAKWGQMVERYLSSPKRMAAIFLLLDIRHKPSANDCRMYEWIKSSGYEPIIIATKADKINRSQIGKHQAMLRMGLGMAKIAPIIAYSSLTKAGREEIYEILASYCEGKDEL
ncbi:MAG: ribosome biogenesis GTP-binding protein YihA/YsxC [Lachnospiraceae bacterium]|jgi:GTP-binding protein|nr:ribosome biogenesis GTP-binding protein YihA/YsxC [Lachnospiraceae bacterium]